MAADPDARFQRAYKQLLRLTLRRPGAGLLAAGVFGRAAGAWAGSEFTLTPDELRALLGPLPRRELARLRSRIASAELRNRCVRALVRERGAEPIVPRMRVLGAGPLRDLLRDKVPVVAVSWHAGVFRAAPLALRELGIPTLVAIGKPPESFAVNADPLLRYAARSETGGPMSGAQFMKGALAHLAAGGVAFFFIDNFDKPGRIQVPFLGRRFPLARGSTTLARLARGRVVPISSRWLGLGGGFEVRIHEPLPEPASPRSAVLEWELELLAGAARLFDAQIRERPESLRLWRWRDVLAAEPA